MLTIAFLMMQGCTNHTGHKVKIEAGQSKKEIRKIIGAPSEIENKIKQNEAIWGAEEEFWDKIAMGARLEVWTYEYPDGTLNLYFINGSDKLAFKAFTPKGVVY